MGLVGIKFSQALHVRQTGSFFQATQVVSIKPMAYNRCLDLLFFFIFFSTHALVVHLREYEEQMPLSLLTYIINVFSEQAT